MGPEMLLPGYDGEARGPRGLRSGLLPKVGALMSRGLEWNSPRSLLTEESGSVVPSRGGLLDL